MSIVNLKRNSRRFKAPISGRGHDGFSLVGGHRNIGAVGNTNLAKSVTRTRFRGNAPMGHGGCCGTYKISICNSGSCSTNDPSIIKSTVKNTKGAILKQYKWIHSAYPNFWVKPDDSMPENHSQGIYVKNLTAQYSNCVVNKENTGIKNCDSPTPNGKFIPCKAASYHIGGKKYYRSFYSKDLNVRPTSCSQYITAGLYKKNNLPTPSCLQSFPMNLSHNGCDVNYFTPQEAISAGALPKDWMNCNPITNPNCVPSGGI
jgi:hypothetical protein